MNHAESSQLEVQFMDITSTQWTELLECGVPCLDFQKRVTRWRLTTPWANLPGLPKRRDLETATVTSTLYAISQSLTRWQSLIHTTTTMTIRANHRPDVWCDICKLRWGMIRSGVWHPKAMNTARWIVKSETKARLDFERAYCLDCAKEAQTMPDGTIWTFREQLNYALGKQEIDGLELG